MDDEQFKILVAEDSLTDRQALEVTLSEANHISLMAKSGAEALEQIDEFQPDIIIIEVNMAELSGIETAKRIREDIEFESVPILFLTCVMCSELIAQCIDAGGTDFIEKPYDKLILASKINALGRMRRLTYELIEQNAKNEANHSRLLQEQTVAKKVFDQLSSKGVMDQDYFRYSMSPLAVFNGDVIVADVSPTGHLFILIGDFTGHGLPAAIGSLPLVNTFYGMVKKGFSISEIMSEINQKLHDILPTGIFCCATCIDINPEERQLCYWAGGLPEGLIYRHKDQTFESLVSRHLPLGVLSSNKFSAKTERTLLKMYR